MLVLKSCKSCLAPNDRVSRIIAGTASRCLCSTGHCYLAQDGLLWEGTGKGGLISVCIHFATEREGGIIGVAGGVFLCCSMMCVGDGIGIISVVTFVMSSCAMA